MSASEFQPNISVSIKQQYKPVSFKPRETGGKIDGSNDSGDRNTALISSTSWHVDAVESPAQPKPVTKAKDPKLGEFLSKYKETLMALNEGAHNLLATIFMELKAATYMTLAVAKGATAEDIKGIQKSVREESCKRLDSAMQNFCDAEVKQAIFAS